MTQKRSRLPGWMPGATSTRGTSETRAGPAPIRARLVSVLLHPTAAPVGFGLVVAAFLIAAETLVVYLLKLLDPGIVFGVVYLLGVLMVSTVWGFGLGAITALASAGVYVYFHQLQTGASIVATWAEDWVAVTVFLVVALSVNVVAGLARSRAAEIDQRRRQVEASRDELSLLATLQSALRRVATLVARGASPSEVFSVVAEEMARCLNTGNAGVGRFEGDEVVVLAVSHFDPDMKNIPVVGERFALEGDNFVARVFRTGAAARVDSSESQNAPGPIAARVRELGLGCTVAVPIVVDGRVWGTATVGAAKQLPPDTEERMSAFADLVATAIANAATRAELIASRARIVAAADEARRRVERDLHDGAQQRLVSLGLQARLAEGAVPPDMQALKQQLCDLVSGLTGVSTDLQEITRGIHPAILSKGGLTPALKALGRRSAVPVTLDLTIDQRLPDSVEVGAYCLVSEALTNAAKHSRATQVDVCGQTKHHTLSLSIHDDGIGGADVGKGSGLLGLRDRVEALGGRMWIKSPPGSGTWLDVTIPLDSA